MTHLCKNNSTKRYTGFEPTPLGLGYSATGYPIGTIKKGRDDNLWRVESNEFSLTKNKYSMKNLNNYNGDNNRNISNFEVKKGSKSVGGGNSMRNENIS